jgi:hypothetical protein
LEIAVPASQPGSTFVFPDLSVPPTPPPAKPRIDTLDFLRSAAELEKILA